jgi:H/ACA ribonucleoprotein complex subunit 3
MVFQCFLYVHPYGGIYKPKDKSKKIKHDLRPLHRITVFNKEVGYPKPARPYDFFSDEILQHFFQTFEKDERGEFPFRLIEGMAWKRPDHAPAQAAVISVITVRGNVTAEKTFTTKGSILKAVMQNDKLRYLYHENETYYREDKQKVCSGKIERGARFGIRGEKTIIGKKDKVVCLDKTGKPEIFPTSKFENVPSFDANGDSVFWIQDGELRKELEKIRKK